MLTSTRRKWEGRCVYTYVCASTYIRRCQHIHTYITSTHVYYRVFPQLAGTLLPIFDPLLTPPSEGKQDRDLIPSFHHPVIRSGRLPGGFNYLHVEKPNTGEPLAVMTARDDYVRTYVHMYFGVFLCFL